MNLPNIKYIISLLLGLLASTKEQEILTVNNSSETTLQKQNCVGVASVDDSRLDCSVTLHRENLVTITQNEMTRTIISNGIPNHMVGLFGGGNGSKSAGQCDNTQLNSGIIFT